VLRRPSLTRTDVLVPVLVLVLGAVELGLYAPPGWGWGILVEGVACLLLVWRRHRPIVTCAAAGIVNATLPFVGPPMEEVATPIFIGIIVAYSLARWVEDFLGLAGLGVVLLAISAEYLVADERMHDLTDLVFVAALLGPPYVFGRVTRRLATTTELLRQQQELVRREAIRDERDRIARELHDVIAHSVSAMVVQTAAAQDLVRRDPDAAGEVLDRVAAIGRRALSETGRLLHVVRDADGELGLAPTPGLGDLPDLVAQFRGDGLRVDLAVRGELADVPAGVDVSAYRIVQEALTNALRYAEDRSVALRVDSTPSALRITTRNASAGRTGLGTGLGLVGLSERVAVLGGTLRHGPVASGVFELDVLLPTAEPR